MSRMAQQVQQLADDLRRSLKKGQRRMTETDTQPDAATDETPAAVESTVDIEPDAPAGEVKMAKAKKAAKKAPKAAKKTATKKTAKAKVAKAPKAQKEQAPKLIVGGLPPLSSMELVGIEGGERNQFVNLTFKNGHQFKLWPSGYDKADERIKARDLMVAWLKSVAL